MYLVYKSAGGGAGDVKLAAALGTLLGPWMGINVLITAYLIAGSCIVLFGIWTVGPIPASGMLFRSLKVVALGADAGVVRDREPDVLRRSIPLAPFFAAAACLCLFGVNWI
jgi:hypothetical protein